MGGLPKLRQTDKPWPIKTICTWGWGERLRGLKYLPRKREALNLDPKHLHMKARQGHKEVLVTSKLGAEAERAKE